MPKIPLVIVICMITALLSLSCGSAKKKVESAKGEPAVQVEEEPLHAEIVLFVLARCPYCADLVRTLVPLVRQMDDDVRITFGFVGSVDDKGQADLLHGDAEVAAAVTEICAGMASTHDQWLDFVECLYRDDAWRHHPEGYDACAKTTGVNQEAMKACIDDGEGHDQLRHSIERAASEGIVGAPTMFINGRRYLGPRDKNSLATYLCHMTGSPETRPDACRHVPVPEVLRTRLLLDKRCAGTEACDIDRELQYLRTLLPTMELEELDYGDKAGRRLYEEIRESDGPGTLPLMVIDSDLKDYPSIRHHLEDYLLPFEDGYLMSLGTGFDPTREICDNGIDDNGDDAVDCADPQCTETLLCREEQKGRLDLFIMSQCPFSAMLIPAVDHFLNHMEKDRSQVDLVFQFIGTVEEDGFDSLHGPGEVEEDLRMACVQELYSKDYKFMEYMMCRARRYHSDQWQDCVVDGMDKKAIEKCAGGDQGRSLLTASFELAAGAGFNGSPSWMLNNRFEMDGRRSTEIHEEYCSRNKTPGCDRPIKPLLIDSSEDVPAGTCN